MRLRFFWNNTRFFGLLLLTTLLAFAIPACSQARLRKANVEEVLDGMSKKQVESILGPPTAIDAKDFASLKKTTYVYEQGTEAVTIIFKDDKVQSKSSTLSK